MKIQNKARSGSARAARSKRSAGLLLFRERRGAIEVFLVHPGGPFWAKRDDGAWSIPKGEFTDDENPLDAAKREFEEETGLGVEGDFRPLEAARQPSGKMVYAWAVRGDVDPSAVRSNTFSIELPKGSGKICEFPEVDRAEWFSMDAARRKILKGQLGFLDQLQRNLRSDS